MLDKIGSYHFSPSIFQKENIPCYWPTEKPVTYGEFIVTLTEECQDEFLNISDLTVTNTQVNIKFSTSNKSLFISFILHLENTTTTVFFVTDLLKKFLELLIAQLINSYYYFYSIILY